MQAVRILLPSIADAGAIRPDSIHEMVCIDALKTTDIIRSLY